MKRRLLLLLVLAALLSLSACGRYEEETMQYDLIPMVMVDGALYLDTGHTSPTDSSDLTADGTITSEVSGSKAPTENDQSNFVVDVPYRFGEEGTVELYLSDQWRIFATEEKRQEIQFGK